MPAIDQAGRILEAVAGHPVPMALADIVRETSLPKSSTHNVTRQLVEIGLLARTDAGHYELGARLIALAARRLGESSVVQRFSAVCEGFPQLPDEAIILSVLDGADMVYVAARAPSRAVGIRYRVGMHLPASCTATGKAVLATRDDAEVESIVTTTRPLALNPAIEKTLSGLLADLERVRKRGYAVDDEETAAGMICFGAALLPSGGEAADLGVAISLVKASVGPEEHEELGRQAMELAQALRT